MNAIGNRNLSNQGKIGIVLAAALTGAIGYWAFRKLRSARTAAGMRLVEAGGQNGTHIDVSELGRRWHGLDRENQTGHIPPTLANAPKEMEQGD